MRAMAELDRRTGGVVVVFGDDHPADVRPGRETGPEAADVLAARLREFYGRPVSRVR